MAESSNRAFDGFVNMRAKRRSLRSNYILALAFSQLMVEEDDLSVKEIFGP
jgi:hypothetical protein